MCCVCVRQSNVIRKIIRLLIGDGHRVAFKLQYSHWDQLETGELQANEIRG